MFAQLYYGNCLDILPTIETGSVQLILCDLPYGTTNNSWDSVLPFDSLWREYKRILKPGGVVALMSQGVFTAKMILSQESLFKYKYTWVKSKATNFLNAKKQPLRKHEDICIFYDKKPVYNPQMTEGEPYNKGLRKAAQTGAYNDFKQVVNKSAGTRYPTDILHYATAETEETVWHPAQKPVKLAQFFVRTYSNRGDTVLDNCFGSGSLLIGAAMEHRNCIGIEFCENYFSIGCERLEKYCKIIV